MVPMLLGMDHLSGQESEVSESALTIDFAIESRNPSPTIFQLPANKKGHYIQDIAHSLALGNTNFTGSPTINIVEGPSTSIELQTLEFHPVEFHDTSLGDAVHDDDFLEQSTQAPAFVAWESTWP